MLLCLLESFGFRGEIARIEYAVAGRIQLDDGHTKLSQPALLLMHFGNISKSGVKGLQRLMVNIDARENNQQVKSGQHKVEMIPMPLESSAAGGQSLIFRGVLLNDSQVLSCHAHFPASSLEIGQLSQVWIILDDTPTPDAPSGQQQARWLRRRVPRYPTCCLVLLESDSCHTS